MKKSINSSAKIYNCDAPIATPVKNTNRTALFHDDTLNSCPTTPKAWLESSDIRSMDIGALLVLSLSIIPIPLNSTIA